MSSTPDYSHIRPMGLGDILDGAIRLYRYNFGPFLGIVAVAWAPALVLQTYGFYWMITTFASVEQTDLSMPEIIVTGAALVMAFVLIYLIAIPIAQGALIWAVSRRYLAQPAGVVDAYRIVLQHLGQIILAIVLTSLVIGAGFLACVLPGLVFTLMFAFTIPEVVLNRCNAVEAMRRSWHLVTFDFWKVLLTLLVLGVLVSIIGTALSAPFEWAVLAVPPSAQAELWHSLSTGMSALIQVLIQPVYIIGSILLYYDLRIRKEGFDLLLLTEAVEQRTGDATARPPDTEPSILAPDAPETADGTTGDTQYMATTEPPDADPEVWPPGAAPLPPKIDSDEDT